MGVTSWLVMTLVALMGAILTKLLADEAKAWLPQLTAAIVAFAVRRAPAELQERLAEEWQSHVENVPGDLGRLLVALDLIRASARLRVASAELQRAEAQDRESQLSASLPIAQFVPEPGEGIQLTPLSPLPAFIRNLTTEVAVELIAKWWHENFEDPQYETPYDSDDGGYYYPWGGPFEAEDVLWNHLDGIVTPEVIKAVIAELRHTGIAEWAPHHLRTLPPDDDACATVDDSRADEAPF